ncbi:MAG: pilus assembly protein PilM, partial [Thermodesulfovibrionales bacterium]
HTEAIERFLNISRDDAESLKKAGNLTEDAVTIINSSSDDIFAEIYRSFEYYKSYVSDEALERIILSGGAALIKNFSDMMAERLSIPVEVADPFRKIKIPSRFDSSFITQMTPIAAVAVGLALRKEGDRA